MDRLLAPSERTRFRFIKEFEYLDLFPYSLAVVMLAGNVYILSAFVEITRALKHF